MAGLRNDRVEIELGEHGFAGWTSYTMDSDLLTPADAFEFEAPMSGTYEQRRALKRRILEAGLSVSVYVSRGDRPRCLQLTGIIDKIAMDASKSGASAHFTGRDKGGNLTASDADPRLGVSEETTLIEVARAMVEPFGMQVVSDGAASRMLMSGFAQSGERDRFLSRAARALGLSVHEVTREFLRTGSLSRFATSTQNDPNDTRIRDGAPVSRALARARRGHGSGLASADIERITLQDARPQVGESIWDFLDRHCRRFGVLPWIDAQGRLVLSAPHYDQDPMFRLTRRLGSTTGEPNNIIAGGVVQDWGALSSECTVYGRARGDNATRSPFHATETNPNQPLYRPLVIHDQSVRSVEEAQRRARRELNQQNAEAFVLEYEVHGHGQGDLIYTIDTVADVIDEPIGVEGLFYITRRTLSGDGKDGTRARLRLIPLDAIQL